MTRHAKIVIGANFGDEGKGLVTDFLASSYGERTVVVRHNGGAQAGHTVTTPDGKRHVFKHFSSGSFVGAKTLLSRFYACNPILFFREKEALEALGFCPDVFVDPLSPITTPYDMMINQIVEETRGGQRHGSCGLGFGETIERTEGSNYTLSFNDLHSRAFFEKRLREIRNEWAPQRLAALGISRIPEVWAERLASDGIFDHTVELMEAFVNAVTSADPGLIERAESVVFEGAQGLLLDQDKGFFPHVTRSSTGIKNAVALAEDYGLTSFDVTYVTRAYATRHGAGPFPHELPEKPYKGIVDRTNVPNDYQGSLRFGWLDLDILAQSIRTDLKNATSACKVSHGVAVTCLDQIGVPAHRYVINKESKEASAQDFLDDVVAACCPSFLLTSHGPTRADVRDEAL
ncbi:MAG: adenylosuccinate synthetase [Alphaproteobacteria bacterium]|nr:adenylosuccinate synthetase [Alphaproteobacteria bacterium]